MRTETTEALPAPRRRFTEHHKGRGLVLRPDHPAVTDGRTIFPSTVVHAEAAPRLLVSGANQRKLGSHVVKGPWKGMPIYALTLEERATCPRTCHHWRSCYGNGMPYARRHRHGPGLEARLDVELEALATRHYREGFAIRLHVLGDFYSIEYANLWHWALAKYPGLHVFGYTARPVGDGIGWYLHCMNVAFPDRCAIRFSTSEGGPMTATVRDRPGVVCPAQTGKTDCCGTCGLCWSPAMRDKAIIFLDHGHVPDPRQGEFSLDGGRAEP